jgi:hypothetical protein
MRVSRTPSVLVQWGCAFALSACLIPLLASAATEVPAERSEWIYFDKYKPELGCFSADITAAQAIIADADAGSDYVCEAAFSHWDAPWPDGKGITDQYQFCPPAGIPYTWAMQHWEARAAKWTYRGYCNSSPTETQSIVARHFFYY